MCIYLNTLTWFFTRKSSTSGINLYTWSSVHRAHVHTHSHAHVSSQLTFFFLDLKKKSSIHPFLFLSGSKCAFNTKLSSRPHPYAAVFYSETKVIPFFKVQMTFQAFVLSPLDTRPATPSVIRTAGMNILVLQTHLQLRSQPLGSPGMKKVANLQQCLCSGSRKRAKWPVWKKDHLE